MNEKEFLESLKLQISARLADLGTTPPPVEPPVEPPTPVEPPVEPPTPITKWPLPGAAPGDRAYFEQQYEAAKDFARMAAGKNGAELLTQLLPCFDQIMSGPGHSTPTEKNFEVTRALYTLMIGAAEVTMPPTLEGGMER